ncbi:MAG: phage holin family protein [Bacilli bacterium]|nr:phage holin family protein [Bacilli bacterium]
MKNIIEKIFGLAGAILIFLLGEFDFLLKAILALMFIDYITGVCSSFVNKKINSSIGGQGIVKKVGYLCVIAVSVILDQMLESNGAIRTLVITTFILNEMLSILENSSQMGIKIPKIIYKSLEKIDSNNQKDSL